MDKKIYTTEYYSAIKNKEILTVSTTWMGLEDIMLSEINKAEKDKYVRSHLYVKSK